MVRIYKISFNQVMAILHIENLLQLFLLVPGPPSNVSLPDVSFNTARIIWDTPEDPNGEILAFKIMFHLNGSQNHQFTKEFSSSTRTFT
jgi:protein sidekick